MRSKRIVVVYGESYGNNRKKGRRHDPCIIRNIIRIEIGIGDETRQARRRVRKSLRCEYEFELETIAPQSNNTPSGR